MNPQEPAQKTDAAPSSLHAYQLPKHIGRYYNIMIICYAAAPLAAALLSAVVPLMLLPVYLIIMAAALCCIIFCLVVGITAIVRIRRSRGALQGNGYVIPSIVMPLIIVLAAVSSVIAFGVGSKSIMEHVNMWYLRQVGDALVEYRSKHNGTLPCVEQWCDMLQAAQDNDHSLFYESNDGDYVTDYALNAGAAEATGSLPEDMVLLFRSNMGWNRYGGPELLPRGFAGRMVSVYLAGGKTQVVGRSEAPFLRWTDENEPAPAPPAPIHGYVIAGAVIAAFCGAMLAAFRRYVRPMCLTAAGVALLAAGAGALCGMAAQWLYSARGEIRTGITAGSSVGLLAGTCFVLLLAYARDRMRPGVSMVGFATVAGALTGAAASTAVHVFLMIGYNDWHVLYPLAGAGFGIWAGILLGWLCSNILTRNKTDKLSEGLT